MYIQFHSSEVFKPLCPETKPVGQSLVIQLVPAFPYNKNNCYGGHSAPWTEFSESSMHCLMPLPSVLHWDGVNLVVGSKGSGVTVVSQAQSVWALGNAFLYHLPGAVQFRPAAPLPVPALRLWHCQPLPTQQFFVTHKSSGLEGDFLLFIQVS